MFSREQLCRLSRHALYYEYKCFLFFKPETRGLATVIVPVTVFILWCGWPSSFSRALLTGLRRFKAQQRGRRVILWSQCSRNIQDQLIECLLFQEKVWKNWVFLITTENLEFHVVYVICTLFSGVLLEWGEGEPPNHNFLKHLILTTKHKIVQYDHIAKLW